MKVLLQWAVLSACIMGLYVHAYGRKAGLKGGLILIVFIGIFLWALNRSGKQDRN